jgi:uncharacterized protein YecE (DUF72 family)
LVDVRDGRNAFVARLSILKLNLGPILLQFASTFAATVEMPTFERFSSARHETSGLSATCFGISKQDML